MRASFWAGFCCAVLMAGGCTSSEKMVITDPPGANLAVNGEPAGATPVKYNFDFNQHVKYEVEVSKDGFIGVTTIIYSETAMADADKIQFTLEKDPSWDDTAESPAANQWLKIQIASQFSQQSMWQRLVDSVTTRYPSLEQMDQSSAYMRSVPIVKTYKNPDGGETTIRTYFTGSLSSNDPLVYKIKIVSERLETADRWVPWHRIFKEDEQLIEELQNRLGMK